MTMDFIYDEYGSLEHITFSGLNGCETVRDLKNALELLKIENPKQTFRERVKSGEFDNTPDDEYEQIVSAVDFAELFHIGRAGLLIDFKSPVSASDPCLSDRHPGVIMAENPGIFLIAFWIGGNFPKVYVVAAVGRLLQHNAVIRIQVFLYGGQGFFGQPFLYPDIRQHAEALWLDENLPFVTFLRSHFIPMGIIGPQEPFPVPSGI